MPYGMPNNGDKDPKTMKFMESCVSKVKGQKLKDGKVADEGTAIAICKTSYIKSKMHGKATTADAMEIFYKEFMNYTQE